MTNREIDALVAEKVMGWTPRGLHPIHECPVFATGTNDTFAPHFSTDIAAAMQVIERMWELGWDGDVEWYKAKHAPGFAEGSRMYRAAFRRIERQQECHLDWATTAPMAICLASLEAVGVEVTEARG